MDDADPRVTMDDRTCGVSADMNERQMAELLRKRLESSDRKIIYDRKNEKLRVEDAATGKGVTITLGGIVARYDREKDRAIEEVLHYINNALEAMNTSMGLKGHEDRIFPVIRSTSFPTTADDGKKHLIFKEHTAETRIFYALDMGESYRLIDRSFLEEEGVSEEAIDEIARFNIRSLPAVPKKDEVAGNVFYFINYNDGYDASRLLNQALIDRMAGEAKGDLAVAVPHQDVLILADLRNKKGYDILQQMTMSFFTSGNIPITMLPFLVEDGKLRPIFIMAKNRPTEE